MKTYTDYDAFYGTQVRTMEVITLGPTDTLGTRVKIKEVKRYDDEGTDSVTLHYDYAVGSALRQAFDYLVERGYNVVSWSQTNKAYYIHVNNWADNYNTLKGVR